MNLQTTVQWAKSLDYSKIEEKQRYKARCYAEMIIEKSTTVSTLTSKIEKYMEDIQEYLVQLDKINLSPEPKIEVKRDVIPSKPDRVSPLLP